MANVQRIAVVDPTDDSREVLRNLLLSVESAWLEAECSRYEFFPDVIEQSPPNVAIISLDGDSEKAMGLISHLASSYPTLDTIACSSRYDGQFILGALRSGAKEFLSVPIQYDELVGALRRLSTSRVGKEGPEIKSKVYAFSGSRGGTGSTSLAINFATILAKDESNKVVFVDLDLAMGDADVCLDIVPDYTLADLAMNIDRIDLQLLQRSLSKHHTGLYLLPHPVQIEDSALIHEEHISRLLHLLKMTFTHIIFDLSKGYSAIDFAAMRLADEVILTTQLDVSSLRNVVRIMLVLGERDGLDQKVKVIANRVGSSDAEITPQRAEETIGRPIFGRIPNDSRTMMSSRNNGIPLVEHAPKSKLFAAISSLTSQITGKAETVVKPKSKGFFFFSND